MAAFPNLLIFWYIICGFVCSAEDSFSIPVQRELGDAAALNSLSEFRKRQSGTNPASLGRSLYWFGNFSVGDTHSLRLLLDTGSSDLLVNPGLYKPSAHVEPYKDKHFSITYEGVDRAGFGFETLNGTVSRDVVSSAGLTVPHQPIGDIKTYKYKDAPQLPYAIQGQGIIGFLGGGSSSFTPKQPSWFFSLCNIKAISQCKLGLAFGTSGKGFTIIGKLAKKLFKGDLTVAPRIVHPFEAWTVRGDVAIGDKIVFKNQTLIMDCGTDNIQAPLNIGRQIFDMLGYQSVEKNGGPNPFDPGTDLKVISGFFPCDKPPKIGFSFPSQSDLENADSSQTSKKSRLFYISPAVWDVFDHGNNNCTSIVGGTNALADPGYSVWLVGQPFFAGHYVDFDIAGTVGFADLKDPSTASPY